MAGNSIIGALRVVIGADSAELETGLKRAESGLKSFAANIGTIAGGIGLEKMVERIAGAITRAFTQGFEDADKLSKSAQKWGVQIEELSALKHAADLSDVSLQTLGGSLSRLAKNMSEIAGGKVNTASKAFEAMGVSVKSADGTLKSSSAVLGEVAGKFASYEDSAAKTALAVALFGRSGAELIPMLNMGKQGLAEMTAEAQRLGLVISSETGNAAEKFNDNLKRVSKTKDGIILQVTARMAPVMANLSKMLFDAASNSKLMDSAAKVLTVTLQGLVSIGIILGASFKIAATNIATVAQALWQAARGDFSGAWETIKSGVVDVGETLKGAADALKTLWVGAANENAAAAPALSDKIAAPIIQSAEKAKNAMKALDAFFLSGTKRRAAMQAELETIGLSAGALESLKFNLLGVNIATEKKIDLDKQASDGSGTLREKIKAQAEALGTLADKLEDNKERYNDLKSAMLSVRSSMESAFVDAVTGAKSLQETIKSLIKDFSRLAAQMAFRALFGSAGSWGNLAGSLFSAFGGGGSNPNIPTAGFDKFGNAFGNFGPPEFAQGGSFKVGGAGGMDSQLRALALTPGERVTVTKDGGMPGGVQFAPVMHIDARGSQMSEGQLRQILAANNRSMFEQLHRALPGMQGRMAKLGTA